MTNITCSFCNKNEKEANIIISGSGAYICDACIDYCNHILAEMEMGDPEKDGAVSTLDRYMAETALGNRSRDAEQAELAEQAKQAEHLAASQLTPQEIKDILDEYVIGQDTPKKVLAVAVYNHYKRILNAPKADVDIDKSNILLLGSTGTGKTYLAKTLAEALSVPFAIADATTLTEAGYVGEDVENIVLKLLQNADYNVGKAERGIIFIDEIDKICRKGDTASITRDVSGEGVQQALLKIIEGTVASIPPQGGRKHPNQEYIHVDTSNILFICGGAFDGLEGIIQRRLKSSVIGFSTTSNDDDIPVPEEKGELFKMVEAEDIISYGIIPEFMGRLPVIGTLDDLVQKDLVRMMVEPKNAIIKQYQFMLALDNVDLEFAPDALEEIASLAIARKLGARGLRSILEGIMMDIMFDAPSKGKTTKTLTINLDDVKKPSLIRQGKGTTLKTVSRKKTAPTKKQTEPATEVKKVGSSKK